MILLSSGPLGGTLVAGGLDTEALVVDPAVGGDVVAVAVEALLAFVGSVAAIWSLSSPYSFHSSISSRSCQISLVF